MKTNKTIRSIVAMTVIFFAVAATSCKKESEIAPTTPTAPVVTPPVVPAVSMKPRVIETSENGTLIRKQNYAYDAQGKLLKYESSTGTVASSDSVLVRDNNVSFKTPGSTTISQSLTFNADKTFKSLFTASDQTNFENNGNKLVRMLRIRTNNTSLNVGEFQYTGNNLSAIGAEIRIDINYHDNLPYQKGINEIPVALKPIKFYKIMEMENATTTVLYNKMIRNIIIDFGNRTETHEYSYAFDSDRRVTQINELITITTSTTSSQKILKSTIQY